MPARGSKLLPLRGSPQEAPDRRWLSAVPLMTWKSTQGPGVQGALGHRARLLARHTAFSGLPRTNEPEDCAGSLKSPVSSGATAIADLTPSSRNYRGSPYASAPRPPWPQRPPPIYVRAALGELRPAFDRHWHETAAFATVDRLPHGGINLPLILRGDGNAAARVCRGAGNGCCSSALAGCATGVGNVQSRCLIRHPVGERIKPKSGA